MTSVSTSRRAAAALALVLTVAPAALLAETSGVSAAGFTITLKTPVRAAPAQVYAALGRIERWWSPAHTYSGQAEHLSLTLRAGGCFCERWAGGEVEHARVVYAGQDAALRLVGGLGPLQDLAVNGVLTIGLKKAAEGSGSEMSWVYRVAGAPDAALDRWAQPVDQVLTEQLQRLVVYAEGVAR